ncbi:sodium/glutamate symporter [Uliginosibacterium sp. sgz301328]|uniref:sodium/glutamate symporter n=1 Tax=Uliginosibacterium sp. sgz301328 TaxID=3243764 RepID=UPI00359DF87B
MTLQLDIFPSLFVATAVLLLGRGLIACIAPLRTYNIPEPVVGGLVAAFAVTVLRAMGIEVSFNTALQTPLMLMFFCTVGLAANIKMVLSGGRMLLRFLLIVAAFLVVQNVLGIGVALALDVNPLLGLLGGSITMSGGHGTGTAWADVFARQYQLSGALEVAMACATFGLVLGGLIGGPVAHYLIDRLPAAKRDATAGEQGAEPDNAFEKPEKLLLITTKLLVEKLFLLAGAMSIGFVLEKLTSGTAWSLPTFVWVMFSGVLVGNVVAHTPFYDMEERALSVIGNTCLSLFLAMALMSLKLWQLIDLALPILAMLIVQTIAMALWAVFVTYRFMGRNYEAVVLAAGHCGFGLGATPTAIANMQTVTNRFGPAHLAFILVPVVGAFFIDLANSVVLKGFLSLPLFAH